MIHKITQSVLASESGSGAGTTVTGTSYQTATNAISIDTTLGTVTNFDIPVAFTTANLKSIILLSNKDAAIKVNSTSSPDVTINLKANAPLLWQADAGYFTNPLTGATTVSHFYVTTGSSLRLQILIISN